MKEQPYYLAGTYLTGFLDEILYKHWKNNVPTTGNGFSEMLGELCSICEAKWRWGLTEELPTKAYLAAIDRSFSGWDLFVDKLRKEKYPFAYLLEQYSYKNAFMKNEKLKDCYEYLNL